MWQHSTEHGTRLFKPLFLGETSDLLEANYTAVSTTISITMSIFTLICIINIIYEIVKYSDDEQAPESRHPARDDGSAPSILRGNINRIGDRLGVWCCVFCQVCCAPPVSATVGANIATPLIVFFI